MFPLHGINISIPSPHGGQWIADCICAVQCAVLVGPWCGWCLSISLAAVRGGGFQWENMSCLQLVFNINSRTAHWSLLPWMLTAMWLYCSGFLLTSTGATPQHCYVTHIHGLCMVKCYSIHMGAIEICNITIYTVYIMIISINVYGSL